MTKTGLSWAGPGRKLGTVPGGAMAESFTTTTERSYFRRLGQSFGGMIGGFVLIIAACILLWWNEGRAVDAEKALAAAAEAVISLATTTSDPANDHKLVHVTGTATTTAPVADDALGARFDQVLVVRRHAEMYQWREESETKTEERVGGGQTETTTYSYVKGWSDQAIDSAGFKKPDGHENPPMALQGALFTASDGRLGGFVLDRETLGLLAAGEPARPATAPAGWTRTGDGYFSGTGSPGQPRIGDWRIRYQAVKAPQTLSILARQSGDGFAAWTAPNGYQIHLARVGDADAALMIADQQAAESTLTWILRGVGTVMNIMGFALILGPVRALANVIPLLATVVGAGVGLVALVLGLPLSLVVIGLAWLAYRPLVGIALLVLAGLIVFGVTRLRKARAAPLPAS